MYFLFIPVVSYITDYYSKDESGTTAELKLALKDAKAQQMSVRDMMHYLKRAYQSKRQIGLSEAIYRMTPELHLRKSNNATKFVHSGFPQNIDGFLRQVQKDDDGNSDEEEGEDEDDGSTYLRIEGRTGLFKKDLSDHEKYKNRPKQMNENTMKEEEWNITLAQFATSYNMCSKKPEDVTWLGNMSVTKGKIKNYIDNEYLPKYIKLLTKKDIFLQLRTYSYVMRMQASRRKTGWEEFYAEMQLFYPWRDENEDLMLDDQDGCLRKFDEVKEEILRVKKKVFPYLHVKEDINSIWEEEDYKRPSHIYDTLDSALEQENLDAEEEGTEEIPGPEFDTNINDEDDQQAINEKADHKYQRLDLKVDEELYDLARSLVPEQMAVLQKVVEYCKIVSCSKCSKQQPLRLIVEGGAGVGKSRTIVTCSQWSEKILRQAGGDPNKPRVLLLGPTGVCASLIDGQTIHSAFNFNFGPEYLTLTPKAREIMKDNLSELKLIIIDEMSMVSADVLYKIHSRLCEVFTGKSPFANKGIILVGDLLQLRPVRARYIFQQPFQTCYGPLFHSDDSLFKLFESITLVHNHRQGPGSVWTERLNRFRIGTYIQGDIDFLKTKVIPDAFTSELQSACQVFFTNPEVKDYNDRILGSMQGQEYIIEAKIRKPVGHFVKIHQTKGTIDDTPYMKYLKIKVGARIMVVMNINTTDKLVNGSFGTIEDIVTVNGRVDHLIIRLDNPNAGRKQRADHAIHAEPYKEVNGTPMYKHVLEYNPPAQSGRRHQATVSVLQYPLKLAWGNTAHTMQGQTVKDGTKMVIHWSKKLQQSMAYVMLSRSENPDDIYIVGTLDPKKIRCNQNALKQVNELKKMSLPFKIKDVCYLSIISLNIRSLRKHYQDLNLDFKAMSKDLICLQETWLHPGEEKKFEIDGHESIFAACGEGKGLATYSKEKFLQQSILIAKDNSFSIMKMLVKDVTVISVYLSKEAKELVEIVEFLEQHKTKRCIVLGDFNFNPDKTNILTRKFKEWNYSQQINNPTHRDGNIIDHVYVSQELLEHSVCDLHYVYYSDHQGVCLTLKNPTEC